MYINMLTLLQMISLMNIIRFFLHMVLQWTKINQDVPVLYCTAKLHKNPYKSRFIVGSVYSTLKQPAKELAIVHRAIQYQFKYYCHKITVRTGINYYWNIDNNKQCLSILKNMKSESIAMFDFSILYY